MATLTAGETYKLELSARSAASVRVLFGGASRQSADAVKTADLSTLDMATGEADEVWAVEADTTTWMPGAYAFEAWATYESGAKTVLLRGKLVIEASLADAPEQMDVRSRAAQMVENIEAMMLGNASQMVRRYKINNRELERYSAVELLDLLRYWRQRLQVEERKSKGISALGPRIAVRF
jgi:hypothetical protein